MADTPPRIATSPPSPAPTKRANPLLHPKSALANAHKHSASTGSLPSHLRPSRSRHVSESDSPGRREGSPSGRPIGNGQLRASLGAASSGPADDGTDPVSAMRPPSPVAAQVELPEPDRLLRLGPAVVKGRQGAVLSRGFLLKTDHWASGRAKDLQHHLQGAPNFRAADLGIFGVRFSAGATKIGADDEVDRLRSRRWQGSRRS